MSAPPILVDTEDEKVSIYTNYATHKITESCEIKPRLGDASASATSTTDPDDFKPKPTKMEISIPTMELLQHEHRIKEEDYKKLDKMKNVSSLFH